MSFEQERLLYLQNKYHLEKLQIDNAPRRTTHEINVAEWSEQKAAQDRQNAGTVLKTKTVAYGSAKPIRLWLEVIPNR
jgi:hypothetical protein